MSRGLWGIGWGIWGIGALIIAAIFALVVPKSGQLAQLDGFKYLIGRWFHTGCWILLAINFFLRANNKNELAQTFALAGGICYGLYLWVIITS